ncbi:alpha/beta fold hydrolase [Streptomyces sp. NBC_00233]|uniref:alpha/beta fold hydrolase n=1 Tax=Streptomyces sp. NBC_00233 TaxID=2975686 RepID=UPI0022529015|nr:alpha/beta fold hydrolase [Streptomyces sp. NBC_00233]MCX5230585.1 dienelactone hydrolase family protein [Streptomyces sp. NBC_00233]
MTAYVLVSGPFTGGWVWEETVSRLRSAGSEAYPVTLPGTGDRRVGTGTGIDLETHIQDLVRLIDGIRAPRVVLVGHGYGLHPVLGAADRRPERVARIVSLDTGLPGDGEAAARSVPDPETRTRLANGDGSEGDGSDGEGSDRAGADGEGSDRAGTDGSGSGADHGWLAPPEPGGWSRWGSTEGIPAEALERLDRLAAPQPVRTLTQPLRLTGGAAALPVTGVLCTANGSSVDLVQMLVDSGPPQFRALAEDRIRFIDLGTGHWPMLSAPEELAEVLARAAAGEGHRVTPSERTHEQPTHLLPFLLDVPEVPCERRGRVDLHLPGGPGAPTEGDPRPPHAERPRPAVVFVHGGPVVPDQRPTPRDTPFLLGYARYAASLGAIGVTLDHRLHGLADFPLAAQDLAEAVALVRADPRVDGDRIALWFFSAGGLLAADWLAAPPPWLRCLAATYPALAPLPGWGAVESRFRPADVVGTADGPPIVLTRAGQEHPTFAATVEEFLTAAGKNGADVEIVDVPHGHHSFELVDPTEESRACLEQAMRSVLGHLLD